MKGVGSESWHQRRVLIKTHLAVAGLEGGKRS